MIDGVFVLRVSAAVALVSVLALGVTFALRRRSAGERHLVWAVALFVCSMVPFFAATGVGWRLPVLPTSGTVPDDRASLAVAPPPEPASRAPRETRIGFAPDRRRAHVWDARSAVTVAYGAGVLAVLASLAVGNARVRRVVRRAERVPSSGVLALANDLSVERIRVRVSADVATPFTVGGVRPVIVLPAVARSWTRVAVANALAHELAHVKRGDWLIQSLSIVACSLHWFNPFVWFARRRLLLEAERACDDAVLSAGGDAIAYAEQLVDLQRTASRAPLLGVPMCRGYMSKRIRAIVNPNPRRSPMTRVHATLVTVGCFVVFGFVSSVRITSAASTHVVERRIDPDGALLRAAARGDLATVRALLLEGADANEAESGSGTPLILAARGGHADVVDLLLERGADANLAELGRPRADDLARTPLGAAARSGALDVAIRLIDAGAEVDRAPRGDGTPLMSAAQVGSLPLLSLLLERGADPNRAVPGDGTALIEAARHGHADVAERLLAAGADPDRFVPGDENALYHAILKGHAGIVRQLVEAGADVHARIGSDGRPLAIAIDQGRADVIDVLVEAGALSPRDDR